MSTTMIGEGHALFASCSAQGLPPKYGRGSVCASARAESGESGACAEKRGKGSCREKEIVPGKQAGSCRKTGRARQTKFFVDEALLGSDERVRIGRRGSGEEKCGSSGEEARRTRKRPPTGSQAAIDGRSTFRKGAELRLSVSGAVDPFPCLGGRDKAGSSPGRRRVSYRPACSRSTTGLSVRRRRRGSARRRAPTQDRVTASPEAGRGKW